MAKKYKRYVTGSDNRKNSIGQGKGSDRRERQVTEEEFNRNWCRSFSHLLDLSTLSCLQCGMTKEAIVEAGEECHL